MKIKEIIDALEQFAPLPLQESYDNAGLQVGLTETEASGALLCLDVTEEVMEEAGLKTDPNCERYNIEALFYAGWIYRFWHYMTGESSKEIFRQADEDEILGSYGLHIEANELAVEDLKAAARNPARKERKLGV